MTDAPGIDLIDSHCHLNFDAFDDDRELVVSRARDAGVHRLILPAVDLLSSREGAALAHQYTGVYAAAGIHPNSSAEAIDSHWAELDELVSSGSFVAVGEIGLDYHWDTSPREAQFRALHAQLELAARHNLPVIIHNREASDDVIAVLETWAAVLTGDLATRPGVLHSFSASPEIAARALAAGFYLGFTGPVTYKTADELRRIAMDAPLDRILIETDSPFLTPTPYRGKRNEPAYVRLVAERIAALRGLTLAELAATTTANTERLFSLPPQNG
ncbi:MAG TPA: TatD family hydrolase [Candidatus Limnocylindrales bacterium]|nr:TatD family hydrolase [Candidatus Limnocylindrales bacterium]